MAGKGPLDQERQMMRQGQYAQAYQEAQEEAQGLEDATIAGKALDAAMLARRNSEAGKKLAAARYEGKLNGYRDVLRARRGEV